MPTNFTVQELAQRWQCSKSKIREMLKSGQLKHWRIDGWNIRVTAAEVQRHESNTDQTEQNAA